MLTPDDHRFMSAQHAAMAAAVTATDAESVNRRTGIDLHTHGRS